VIAAISFAVVDPALAQKAGDQGTGTSFKDIAEGVGAAVGTVLALLGAPTIYLGIKKSQAEIRKLELETAKLQAEQGDGEVLRSTETMQAYNVVVDGRGNSVSITADPRLLGPLLLLLDFVTVTIVLTVAGYLLNFGGLTIFSPLLAVVAIALFAPILREARRLKRVLAPDAAVDASEAPAS
jgi:hypothetical protein